MHIKGVKLQIDGDLVVDVDGNLGPDLDFDVFTIHREIQVLGVTQDLVLDRFNRTMVHCRLDGQLFDVVVKLVVVYVNGNDLNGNPTHQCEESDRKDQFDVSSSLFRPSHDSPGFNSSLGPIGGTFLLESGQHHRS